VYIAARVGSALAVNAATVTDARTGVAVPLRPVVTATSDPQGEYGSSEAYVVADAPLAPNTPYQVNISGTNNGAAFDRSFTFTTGP
jgi:hypothetical protein